jgi:hypothetical protein
VHAPSADKERQLLAIVEALEAGGFLVGDDVKIEIELEAIRQDPASEVAN